MPGNSPRKRVPAEDSDSESEHDTQDANNARDEALKRLQEIDLGTYRAGRLKQDDRRQKNEDRANVKLLLNTREACQEGTEAHALYSKNKCAVAAWNNSKNVVDNHEEDFDPLDGGNAHRQRMRNEHGGKVEEPDDWEAGYAKGGRGRRARGGGIDPHGGRGGSSMPAPTSVPTPFSTRGRAGIAQGRPGPQSSRPAPTQLTNYRPLDPAIDPDNDPRSKYAKAPTRGDTHGGRGGGNVGRGSGRAEFNTRAAPTPVPALSRVPRAARQNHIDLLADPAAFMRAVSAINTAKLTATKTSTEMTTTVNVTTKASSTAIESKWGDAVSAKPTAALKPSTNASVPPPAAAAANTNANIRQVPTNEFALPHPHRGDTESWTDGIPSDHLSAFESPVIFSQASNQSVGSSPVTAQGNVVGLGIEGVDTTINEDVAIGSGNTANGMDLMDVTEDLTALQEPPIPRAALAKRIVVNGGIYILDESALGNASSIEVLNSTPAPPQALTQSQGEWTSPADNTITGLKPKALSNNSNRNVAAASGTQTTPSLTKSKWADMRLSLTHVDNPFANGTAPARADLAQVQFPGEFIAFVRDRPDEEVSAFLNTKLTSPGVESVTSTPNLASLKWGRTDAQLTASLSGRVQSSSTLTANSATATIADAAANATQAARPAVIDNFDLVRLQAVGNAAFGMTPFRPTPTPSSTSIPKVPAPPTRARQKSAATSINSDATASSAPARGLTASKYASKNVASTTNTHLGLSALQSLALNSPTRPRGHITIPKPPPPKPAFGNGSNFSAYAIRDENTRPNQTTNSTSNLGTRSSSRFAQVSANSSARVRSTTMEDGQEYKPIRETRTEPGPGFALLQGDIAAGIGPSKNPGLFSSTSSTFQSSSQPALKDDSDESGL